VAKPDELTVAQATFVLEYTRNGGNATLAYRRGHPDCKESTCWTEGHRTLRLPKVASAIRRVLATRFKRLEMSGDEAVALTGLRARADIGMVLDEKGELLPRAEWPLEFRKAVKEIKPDGTVRLHDQQKATETVLRMTGKLRDAVDVNHFDHLGYLAAIEQKRRAAQGVTDGKAGDSEGDREGGAQGGRRSRRRQP
jgi:phage terminase small subunit